MTKNIYTQADRDQLVASFLDLSFEQIAEAVRTDDAFLEYLEANHLDQYLGDALEALKRLGCGDTNPSWQSLYLRAMAGMADVSLHMIVHRISEHCPLEDNA